MLAGSDLSSKHWHQPMLSLRCLLDSWNSYFDCRSIRPPHLPLLPIDREFSTAPHVPPQRLLERLRVFRGHVAPVQHCDHQCHDVRWPDLPQYDLSGFDLRSPFSSLDSLWNSATANSAARFRVPRLIRLMSPRRRNLSSVDKTMALSVAGRLSQWSNSGTVHMLSLIHI